MPGISGFDVTEKGFVTELTPCSSSTYHPVMLPSRKAAFFTPTGCFS